MLNGRNWQNKSGVSVCKKRDRPAAAKPPWACQKRDAPLFLCNYFILFFRSARTIIAAALISNISRAQIVFVVSPVFGPLDAV